jgi:hypothetical protein
VIRLPHYSWTEQEFIALTADIGVPWSLAKLRPLASVQRYIGFDWGPRLQISWSSGRQAKGHVSASIILASRIQLLHSQGSSKSAWQTNPHLLYFSINSAFPPFSLALCIIIHFIQSSEVSPSAYQSQPKQSILYSRECSKASTSGHATPDRPQLVGRCKLLIRYWSHSWFLLGGVEMGTRCQSRTTSGVQYRLG